MVVRKLIASLGLAGLLSPLTAAVAAPDLVIHNGVLYTANPERQFSEAMAVSDERIVAVGSNEEILALAGGDTRVVDLAGRLVLPGLHDTHIHAMGLVEYEGCNLDSQALDLAALAAFVGECVERLQPPPGEWLTVRQWNFANGNQPTSDLANVRQALDKVSRDTPIVLLGNDGHHNATNSAGLAGAITPAGESIGLSRETLAREFAALRPFVGVDASGEPNGAVNEHAVEALGGPSILTADLSLIVREADQVPDRLASLGITSIQDAAVPPAITGLYDAMLADGPVPLRVRLAQLYPPQMFMDERGRVDMPALLAQADKVRAKYADVPGIDASALKLFADGVLEGNPLATPPTLPNAAVLGHFHQPRFSFDEEAGRLDFGGYVDTEGKACRGWEVAEGPDAAKQVQTFMQANGFHPGQCFKSRGELAAPAEVAAEFVAAADAAGYAVHIHAIGDRAVRVAINAIAAVTPESVETNLHSMTHLQLVSDAEIKRLGELKIPLAMTYAWAARFAEYDWSVVPFIDEVGPDKNLYPEDGYVYRNSYPVRAIRDAGGVLAAGSDAPVDTDDPRPFVNIQTAVTRDRGEGSYNPDQTLDILDAIDAYTINGARLMDQADKVGSLEAGKLADFIVLDQDIIALARQGKAGNIDQTRVLQTWFAGERVYEAKP